MNRVLRKDTEVRYFDNLLAAVPGSVLIKEAFEVLS